MISLLKVESARAGRVTRPPTMRTRPTECRLFNEEQNLFYIGGCVGTFSLNSCPRCKGDVLLGNEDQYGWYEQCLQCGYIRDLQTIVQVEQPPAEEKKKTKLPSSKRREFK